MANLLYAEKKTLELFLVMSSGYVLDFSSWDFKEFVHSSVDIDIFEEKYELGSGSKANRLRKFWSMESDANVSKLLYDLSKYWHQFYRLLPVCTEAQAECYNDCLRIAEKLSQSINNHINSLQPHANDKDSEKLVREIITAFRNNEPEVQMDRLHTYLGKHVRIICDKHSIPYNNTTPLNSIFGGYVKFLEANQYVESEMTLKILKMTISVLEGFNDVRNNKSFAHPNELLNNEESTLIFNHVSGLINFVNSVEKKIQMKKHSVDLYQ